MPIFERIIFTKGGGCVSVEVRPDLIAGAQLVIERGGKRTTSFGARIGIERIVQAMSSDLERRGYTKCSRESDVLRVVRARRRPRQTGPVEYVGGLKDGPHSFLLARARATGLHTSGATRPIGAIGQLAFPEIGDWDECARAELNARLRRAVRSTAEALLHHDPRALRAVREALSETTRPVRGNVVQLVPDQKRNRAMGLAIAQALAEAPELGRLVEPLAAEGIRTLADLACIQHEDLIARLALSAQEHRRLDAVCARFGFRLGVRAVSYASRRAAS